VADAGQPLYDSFYQHGKANLIAAPNRRITAGSKENIIDEQ
jgi:hypothetical protein